MSPIGLSAERVARRGGERLAEGEPFEGVRRIAVVLGDATAAPLFAAPAVAALRRAYPGAWIGLLAAPRAIPAARLVASADAVSRDGGDPSAVPRAEPNLLLDLTGGLRVAWAARRARVRHRVGFGRRVYASRLDRGIDPRRIPEGLHEVDRALALAQRAGATPAPADFALAVPPSAEESAEAWLALQRIAPPFVLLLPGASPGTAAWPAGHWARLAALLRGEGVACVVAVSLAEGAVARVLDAAPSDARRAPRFDGGLDGLAALSARAAVVIGNGSGPVHLAAALGAPALSFHGREPETSVSRTGPYAERGWGVTAPPGPGRAGLEGISPAAVLSFALTILDGRDPDAA